ncbi:MAG: PorV/PorQ family protein [Endomicrobiales bacterium]|nr:PorV/PorQ family protein [Endomicrobiales bacterium]
MKNTFFITLLILFGLSPLSHAVTTGADFLKLSIGARATGIGESYVSICPDATASYWNPAGLAKIQKPELFIMHSEAVTDASLEFVGFAYPTSKYGTVCLSGIFYIIKPIPVTLQTGQVLGELNWTDNAFILSYGKKVIEDVSLGVGIKYIHRSESDPIFGSSKGNAYAIDLGIIYKTPIEGLNTGLSVLNTGNKIRMSGETKEDVLPQTTRFGLSYEYKLNDRISTIFANDYHKILNSSWYASGGAELNFQDTLFFRMGYYKKEGNIQGTTYGLGFKIKQFQIDYSNIPASEMVGYTRNNKLSFLIQF